MYLTVLIDILKEYNEMVSFGIFSYTFYLICILLLKSYKNALLTVSLNILFYH